MTKRNLVYFLLVMAIILTTTSIPIKSQYPSSGIGLIVDRNVNMVAGQELPGGDPYLQRQNEPSIAVSTRNPMHLLAACNDYRTVDMPYSEGPLPGIDLKASASGDAWLGIFKSYNGGQSWKSTLLPGYPQDESPEGIVSPLHGYSTACDPTVRAGSSGLFFTSGIVFNRIEHGGSGIFVARYIDNNTQAIGDMDSIKYIDTTYPLIDEGTSGQFADKPWIAIDAPYDSSDTVPIESPGAPTQYIPRFNVYIVYSIFLGSETSGAGSQIMFARSTDCGNTWEKPIKLSESVHICQGTNIAVSPKDGTIYIVWRQYAREDQGVPHAIVMCSSDNSGSKFTKATVFYEIDPFDQFTYGDRFRTSAFPALAVDPNGIVYGAWSQRGVGPNGEARIVIKTYKDRKNYSEPEPVDNHSGGGHQIMPSLTCAGGKLMMTWYDTRKSLGNVDADGNYTYHPDIADPGPTGYPHTLDVWVAQAEYSSPPNNPVFTNSTQVSRYLYQARTVEGTGQLLGTDLLPLKDPADPSYVPPYIYQAQFNYVNFPIFMEGNAPFVGDYIDITPAPMFLHDDLTGAWRFNTGEGDFDPTQSYVTFACNRDVVPPSGGLNWMSYWPPGSGDCSQYTAGMRNQNIYSASVSHGIMVGSPVNTKPLEQWRRSFLVFVKNLADYEKLVRLTIDAPEDMNASFWEVEAPQGDDCPFLHCQADGRMVELSIFPHSSITLTVFVQPYTNPLETFRVIIEEIDEDGILTGLRSAVVLNPDPVNTQFIPAEEETHNPIIIVEEPDPLYLSDPTMLSDPIVYAPYLEELLNFSNPDIVVAGSAQNPRLRNPRLRNDTIINPRLRNTAVGSMPDGQVTDLRWTVINDGNTTSAYSFEGIGEYPSVPHQILIHRVTNTPVSPEQCLLSKEEHHELLLSIENPRLRNPRLRNPRLRNPRLRNNTFFLAPGEEAIITLRLIDPEPDSEQEGLLQSTQSSSDSGTSNGSFDPEFYAKTVAGAAIPQATNPNDEIETAAFMWIYTTTPDLPDGLVNVPYEDTLLEAEGGTGPYAWSLVPGYENLPPGLTLDSDGTIGGTPTFDGPYENDEKIYDFAVQATDSTTPTPQIAYRNLSIKIISPNTAPVAYDQHVETNEDTFVEITLMASDAENDPLTYSVTSGPTNGTLSGTPPDLTYIPDDDYYGPDSFMFIANDGQADSNEATVTITVNPVNDPPSFSPGSDVAVNEDSGNYLQPWASNMSPGPENESEQTLTFNVTNNNNDLFAVQPSIDATSGDLNFRPADDMFGQATVTVTLSDDGGTDNGGDDTSEEATFVLTVNPVNDAPSFSPGSDVAVNEDSGNYLQPWASNMSAGPENESGQTLTFNVINDNNDLFAVQPSIDAASGDLNFRPADDMFGQATVTVTLSDDGGTDYGGVDTSAPVMFVITIIAVQDAPMAVDDNYTLIKGPPKKGNRDYVLEVSAEDGVLANDTDADGDSLTAVMLTQPIRGGITFNSDGSFRYRLNDEFVGTVIFTYQVSDGNGGTDTATVTITVVN